MGLVVSHNANAINTNRNILAANKALGKSLENLSSGYRINSGADAPADLVISEKLRVQQNGLERAIRNTQESYNVLGIAEGALNEMNSILTTLRELALHSANSGITSPEQMMADQSELDSGISTIQRIASTTKFGSEFLLDGQQEIMFSRSTQVNEPMDNPLLNLSETRIDQISKRDGTAINVSFSAKGASTIDNPIARHDTVDDDIFIEGKYLSLGVSGAGSFGTDNDAPSDFNPVVPATRQTVGMGVDQDGWGVGADPTTGDFFLPGNPEEGFTVGYNDGANHNFTNVERNSVVNVTPTNFEDRSAGNTLAALWEGTTSDNNLEVSQVISFDANEKFYKTTITLKNVSGSSMDNVRYMRSFDPDQDADITGEYSTVNTIRAQGGTDGKAIVSAAGPDSGVPVFFYSDDSRARVSNFGFTNRDVYAAQAWDAAPASGTSSTSDSAITITFDVATLNDGEATQITFYTSLDENLEEALAKIEAGNDGTGEPLGELYNNEARKAYIEADGNLDDVDIDGNVLSEDQQFTLGSDDGERKYSFSEGTTLGSVVESINNNSGSTGVNAQLIFSSNAEPSNLSMANWTSVRKTGCVEVYGAGLNSISQADKVDGLVLNADSREKLFAGRTLDGQGRMYAKVVGNDGTNVSFEYYRDKALTMQIGAGTWDDGADKGTFTEVNNSGIKDGGILLHAVAAEAQDGDVYTLAFAGMELNSTASDSFDTEQMKINRIQLDDGSSVVTGIDLGRNTDADGKLYFSADGDASSRSISIYKDAEMTQLVAWGEADLSAAGSTASIRVEEVNDSGLNATITCATPVGWVTETGVLAVDDLAIRVYGEEYGANEAIRVQSHEGTLWTYFSQPGDDRAHILEEGESIEVSGCNAVINVNGYEVQTEGLVADVSTPEITAHLVFDEGEIGATTIAQVGYDSGSIFSRATGLHLDASGDILIPDVFTHATNARSSTVDLLDSFEGGMRMQLDSTAGVQSRTVFGIQSMNVSGMGMTEFTDDFDGDGVEETMDLSLSDVMGGGFANLYHDPVKALSIIDKAIDEVCDLRSRLGATQSNLLQTNINNLQVSIENVTSTESNIRDANMAYETTEFTKSQILTNTSSSMLVQANSNSQKVLELIGSVA